MPNFTHDGFDFAYVDEGEGEPVLLIHGFASNKEVNWIGPGWVAALTEAGYRVVALDNRGHGETTKSHDPEDYSPQKMAGDAIALLDTLRIGRAHIFGYSMGARISAFLARDNPDRVASLIFGGLGINLVEGVGDWQPVVDALLADDTDALEDRSGMSFRHFADKTGADRKALAACITTNRVVLSESDVRKLTAPALIGVGTRDDVAGSAERLADLMADAEAFAIEKRDHMLAVGDASFKKRVLTFLAQHRMA